MKRLVFFDLDGTLLDQKKRYFMIHQELCKQVNISSLPQNQYWDLKRKKISEENILKKNKVNQELIDNYLRSRKSLLEDLSFLKYDQLFTGVFKMLENLSKKNDLIIVTNRKNRENLLVQIESLKISHFFKKILNANTQEEPRYLAKTNIINKHISLDDCKTWFFGDSEMDMQAGKSLKSTTVAVSLGIRESELLAKLLPDYLIDTLEIEKWPRALGLDLGV